jgi:hypothetical protein
MQHQAAGWFSPSSGDVLLRRRAAVIAKRSLTAPARSPTNSNDSQSSKRKSTKSAADKTPG